MLNITRKYTINDSDMPQVLASGQAQVLTTLPDHGNVSKRAPTGRKRKATSTENEHSNGVLSTSQPKKPKTTTKKELPDVSTIHLNGEEDEAVPIFDTCDEIRRKVNRFLRTYGMTKAEFLRQILKATFHDPPDLQYKYLHDFMGKKGPDAGASTVVYYAAYVYLEKVRIKEGKPKSKHRQQMEETWWPKGMPRRKGGKRFTCPTDMRPYMDKFGKVEILPKGRR